MKKIIALLLALALCAGLGGMGSAAAEPTEEELMQQLLDGLEAGMDADGEIIEITADNWLNYFTIVPEYQDRLQGLKMTEIQGSINLKSEPGAEPANAAEDTAADAVEVPITLANWSEYFEIAEDRQEQENAFGELGSVRITYYVDVREEYADKVAPVDSTVAFAATADTVTDGRLEGTQEYTVSYNPVELENGSLANRFETEGYYEEYASDGTTKFVIAEENFTVTRVEGSLFLTGVDPEQIAQAEADAAAAAEAAQAAESAPVEITMDNWSEYFEFRDGPLKEQTNAFGEVESVESNSLFVLKEDYAQKLDTGKENAAAVAMDYEVHMNDVDSPANGEYVLDFSGDEGYYGAPCGLNIGKSDGNGGVSEWVQRSQNFSVTRIQGTIYLYP